MTASYTLWSSNVAHFHISPWDIPELSWERSWELPSGYVNSLLWKMVIEIVSCPIKNGDFP